MRTNIYGEKLITCSTKPMTGYYRNGSCNSEEDDTLCIQSVLLLQKISGFFIKRWKRPHYSSPRLEFPGLVPGDHWCLCASRWVEHGKPVLPPMLCSKLLTKRLWNTFLLKNWLSWLLRFYSGK